jgi:spermidine/putrescine transport system ATP-binding protein
VQKVEKYVTRAAGGRDTAGIAVDLDPDCLGDVANGDPYAYTIRPESMRIGRDTLDCRNEWTGTVENAIYKGSDTVYEVDVGARTMRVQRQRRTDIEMFDEAETVVVGFDGNDGELIG